jgi:protein-S-isoprenylcysteine O-methyltransferase Ste14
MMIAVGNFLFRYRNALFPLSCALLLLPGRPLFSDPMAAAGIGFAIAACGQCIRAATIGLRYIVRGGRGGRVYADDLITEGLYALCRNPMYVGNILIVIGVAVASNSLTTIVCAVPLVVFAYTSIVAAEEQFLRGKFGPAFERYCADTPRWLPRIAELRTAFASGSFHWRRVIVKEYGTPFGWVNALCLISLYNLWRYDALRSESAAMQTLLAAMGLISMFWLIARVLKKTHRMVAD